MKGEVLNWVLIGILVAYLITAQPDGSFMLPRPSDLLSKMADAIQQFEGWFAGSTSQRNNNPGNIKYFGGAQWQGQIGTDERGFVKFDSYENGRRALLISLKNAASGLSNVYSPNDTLLSFFQKYAPSSDNNHPEVYAKFVADKIGVDYNSDTIGSFLV